MILDIVFDHYLLFMLLFMEFVLFVDAVLGDWFRLMLMLGERLRLGERLMLMLGDGLVIINFLYCCTSSIVINYSMNLSSFYWISFCSNPLYLVFLMFLIKLITYFANFCLSLSLLFPFPLPISLIYTTLLNNIFVYLPTNYPLILILFINFETTSIELILISMQVASRIFCKKVYMIG